MARSPGSIRRPNPTACADRNTATLPGQAQKEAFVNEAFARLDALVQPVIIGVRATPPAVTPSPGDCYLVADGASGAWTGHDRAFAIWAGNQWLYSPARDGGRVYDLASASHLVFSAAAGWHQIHAPSPPTGGAVQDIEVRGVIVALLAGLRAAGIFSA